MAHPSSNLLALSQGMGAWGGKALKTLDVHVGVDPLELERAVETMRTLGHAAFWAHWTEPDAGVKKDFGRIARDIHSALEYAR